MECTSTWLTDQGKIVYGRKAHCLKVQGGKVVSSLNTGRREYGRMDLGRNKDGRTYQDGMIHH